MNDPMLTRCPGVGRFGVEGATSPAPIKGTSYGHKERVRSRTQSGDDEPFIWSTRPEWTVVEVGWLCSSGSHVVGGQDALRRIVEAVVAAGLKALVPVDVPAFCGAGVG